MSLRFDESPALTQEQVELMESTIRQSRDHKRVEASVSEPPYGRVVTESVEDIIPTKDAGKPRELRERFESEDDLGSRPDLVPVQGDADEEDLLDEARARAREIMQRNERMGPRPLAPLERQDGDMGTEVGPVFIPAWPGIYNPNVVEEILAELERRPLDEQYPIVGGLLGEIAELAADPARFLGVDQDDLGPVWVQWPAEVSLNLIKGVTLAYFELAVNAMNWVAPDLYGEIAEAFRDVRAREHQIRSERLNRMFADGEGPEAIAVAAIQTMGDVAGFMNVMKAFTRGAGLRGIKVSESTWRQVARNQGARAGLGFLYSFLRTDGTNAERFRAGALTFAYMMTPVASARLPNNWQAIFGDFVQNAALSMGWDPEDARFTKLFSRDEDGTLVLGGQYGRAMEAAQADADAMGLAEDDPMRWMVAVSKLIPVVGMDIGFSLLARSARANNDATQHAMRSQRLPDHMLTQAQRDNLRWLEGDAIREGLDPGLARTLPAPTLEAAARGDLDIATMNAAFRADTALLREKQDLHRDPKPQPDALGRRAETPDEMRRLDPDEFLRETDLAARRAERGDMRDETLSSIVEVAPDQRSAVAAMRLFSRSSVGRQVIDGLYWSKVASGEIAHDGIRVDRRGIHYYSGSPHRLEAEVGFPHGRFVLERVPQGDGAQDHGWGVYIGGTRRRAEQIRGITSKASMLRSEYGDLWNAYAWYREGKVDQAIRELDKRIQEHEADAQRFGMRDEVQREINRATRMRKQMEEGTLPTEPGNIYRIAIPEDVRVRLLDWDLPLIDQPRNVQLAARDMDPNMTGGQFYRHLVAVASGGAVDPRTMMRMKSVLGKTEEQLAIDPQRNVSEYLSQIGVPGNRHHEGPSPESMERTVSGIQRRIAEERQHLSDWEGRPRGAEGRQDAIDVISRRITGLERELADAREVPRGENTVIWSQKVLDEVVSLQRNAAELDQLRERQGPERVDVAPREDQRGPMIGEKIDAIAASVFRVDADAPRDRQVWTPERIARLEDVLPDTVARAVVEGFAADRPSFIRLSQNADRMMEELKVSGLGFGERMDDGRPKATKGNQLARGMAIGLAHLRESTDWTPHTLHAKLSRMARGGEQGVKGFGQSAREALFAAWKNETPEQALQHLNEMRMARGAEPIMDVEAATFGGVRVAGPHRLTDAEADLVREAFPDRVPESVRENIIKNTHWPLSSDKQLRDAQIDVLVHFGEQAATRLRRQGSLAPLRILDDFMRSARQLASSRHFFAQLAADLGDPVIFDSARGLDLGGRRADFNADTRLEMANERAGLVSDRFGALRMTSPTHRFIGRNPKIQQAIISITGIDPRGNNPDLIRERTEAEAVLARFEKENPEQHAKVMAFQREMMNELQGTTAANVRYLQAFQFVRAWETPVEIGGVTRTVGEHWAAANRAGDTEAMAAIERRMARHMPWKYDESSGEGRPLTIREMLPTLRAYAEGGYEGMRNHTTGETGGTREYYWMTDARADRYTSITPDRIQEMFRTDVSEMDVAQYNQMIRPSGVIHHREEGAPLLRDVNMTAAYYRHVKSIQTQADTIHHVLPLMERINRAHQDGMISDRARDGAEKWVRQIWGRGDPQGRVAEVVSKGRSAFWQMYAFSANKIAWYTARNMVDQGTPFGFMATHLGIGDIRDAYGQSLIEMRDPNSRLSNYLASEFQSDVSQSRQIFHEAIAMRDPALRYEKRVGDAYLPIITDRITQWAAFSIGFSDTRNRLMTGSTSYLVADRYVERYLSGEIGWKDVDAGLKLDVLSDAARAEVMSKFNEGVASGGNRDAFEPFVRTVAEMKTEAINFQYRLAGKSLAEQDAGMRHVLGLITYPKGHIENLYFHGVRPLTTALNDIMHGRADRADMDQMYDGLRVIGMEMAAATITAVVFDNLIGAKDDRSPTFSPVPTYDLFGPGAAMLMEIIQSSLEFVNSMLHGEPGLFRRESRENVERWLWHALGPLNDLQSIFEGVGGIEAATNAEAFRGVMYEHFGFGADGIQYVRYEPRERSAYAALIKTVFGTDIPDPDQQEPLIDQMVENNLIGRLIRRHHESRERQRIINERTILTD